MSKALTTLIDAVLKGYGRKDSKRGVLATTEEGVSLDALLEVRGKADKPEAQYVAVVSKATKTIRVASAKDVAEARKFLASQAKAVASRKPAAAKANVAVSKADLEAAASGKPKPKRSGVKVTIDKDRIEKKQPVSVHAK
jgi:hypothetical protein